MLKDFVTQIYGKISLQDYETALDEILKLRKENADLLAMVEAAEPVAIRWREICGPYANVALDNLEAALAKVKPQ